MTFLIRYWPHALIVAVTATIVAFSAHSIGAASGDRRAAKAELALSHLERDTAYRLAEAEAKARQVEQRRVEDLAALDAKYQRELDDAKGKAESVAADLRAGNLRLRQHWQASIATCELSGSAAAALHADEVAQLRAESAARIVRLGAEADAQIRALQEAYEALRRPAP